jgi:hypothetical protein
MWAKIFGGKMVKIYIEVLKEVERAFEFIQKNFPEEECKGIFLEIADLRGNGRTILSAEIGDVAIEMGNRCQKRVRSLIDKFYILVKNSGWRPSILSSREIVDSQLGEQDRLIYVDNYLFSVFGHSGNGNEAMSIVAFLALSQQKTPQSFKKALRAAYGFYLTTNEKDPSLNKIILAVVKEIFGEDLSELFLRK